MQKVMVLVWLASRGEALSQPPYCYSSPQFPHATNATAAHIDAALLVTVDSDSVLKRQK